ncbi:MAG: hypothetical protein ABI295_07350 [Xanthomarina sp.]
MNKKSKTYLLIFAVLSIWGTIAYKFFSAYNPVAPVLDKKDTVLAFKPLIKETDTFYIQELERDPFLGTIKKNSSIKNTYTVGVKRKDTIQVPKMSYLGSLKKQQSKDQIFALNINDEQFLVKRGQTVESVSILQADSRKMVVRFQNQTITLPIQ